VARLLPPRRERRDRPASIPRAPWPSACLESGTPLQNRGCFHGLGKYLGRTDPDFALAICARAPTHEPLYPQNCLHGLGWAVAETSQDAALTLCAKRGGAYADSCLMGVSANAKRFDPVEALRLCGGVKDEALREKCERFARRSLCGAFVPGVGGGDGRTRHRARAHRGRREGCKPLPRLGGPLSAAGRRCEADLEARQAAKTQRARLSPPRRRHPGRRHRSVTPSPAPRHGDRRRHPRPLCGSAPLRETNAADPTTTRSKSRSPTHPNRSRRAAEPQSAHLKRGRWGLPAQLRITAIVGDTPDLSAALRLCARQTTPRRPLPARRADRRHTRTGRAEPQSRRALTSSATVGDIQTVGAGRRSSATPQPLGGLASWRETNDAATTTARSKSRPEQVAQSRRAAERSPQARALGASRPSERDDDRRRHRNLLAAWRLGARKTTPRRPPPARRADRRHTRTGRAEPQSRRSLTSSAIVGDIPLRLQWLVSPRTEAAIPSSYATNLHLPPNTSSNVAMSRSAAQAARQKGKVNAAALPSPRRSPQSKRGGPRPSASSTTPCPGSAERVAGIRCPRTFGVELARPPGPPRRR
jgi:hypothetical protein